MKKTIDEYFDQVDLRLERLEAYYADVMKTQLHLFIIFRELMRHRRGFKTITPDEILDLMGDFVKKNEHKMPKANHSEDIIGELIKKAK